MMGMPFIIKSDAYYYLGKYNESLSCLDKAIEFSDYDADAYYAKCRTYLELEDKESAYTNFKKALGDDEEYIYYIDVDELSSLKGYKDFDRLINGEEGITES